MKKTSTSRKPFALWSIGEEEYKLKLTTAEIARLEQIYGCSLVNLLTNNDSMPALTVMLDLVHGGLQKYHHGISREDVNELFDKYVDEGGSQTDLLSDVVMELYQVSGFFSKAIENQMVKDLEKAQKKLS